MFHLPPTQSFVDVILGFTKNVGNKLVYKTRNKLTLLLKNSTDKVGARKTSCIYEIKF